MCLNQPFGQIRVNIFVLVTDTDIYSIQKEVMFVDLGLAWTRTLFYGGCGLWGSFIL